jgi:hypothetical protein
MTGNIPVWGLWALLFVILALGSCRTSKVVVRQEKVRPMNERKLYNNVISRYVNYKTLSLKYSADFEDSSRTQSFNGVIRMKRDSVIWINITAVGIEVARLLLTPDSIKFMDKFNKKYFAGSYDYLEKNFQVELGFKDLQSIFSNEIFLYSENDDNQENFEADNPDRDEIKKIYKSYADSNLYVLQTARKRKLKRQIRRNKTADLIVERIFILPELFRISRITVQDYTENRSVEIGFSDFVDSEGKIFPEKMKLIVKNGNKFVNIGVKYQKMTVDEDFTVPFKVPEKYTRVQ